MPDFGQNVAEILIRARAEGRGEFDALQQEIARLKTVYEGYLRAIARGDETDQGARNIVSITKSANACAREIKMLEETSKAFDPVLARMTETADEVARTFARAAKEAHELAEAEREMAALHSQVQAALGGYEQRDRAAADAEISRQAELNYLQERAAIQANLGQMEERDARDRLEAAELAKRSTREAIENLRQVLDAQRDVAAAQKEAADAARQYGLAIQSATTEAYATQLRETAKAAKEYSLAVQEATNATIKSMQPGSHSLGIQDALNAQIKEMGGKAALAAESTKTFSTEIAKLSSASTSVAPEMQRLTQFTAAQKTEMDADAAALARVHPEITKLSAASSATAPEMQRLTQFAAAQKTEMEGLAAAQAKSAAAAQEAARTYTVDVNAATNVAMRNMRQNAQTLDIQDNLNKMMKESGVQWGRYTQEVDKGVQAKNRFGYAILNISHGLQDMQYGMGAVLNNIPLMVMSIGGGAGLAGTLMAAGVGASVFGGHLKTLARDIGILKDPLNWPIRNLEDMEERLKGISDKTYKVAVDYAEIDRATEQIDKLDARLKAYQEAVAAQTPEQQKVAKAVKEVFVGAGQVEPAEAERGGAGNIGKMVVELADRLGAIDRQVADDPRTKLVAEARAAIAASQARIDAGLVPAEFVQSQATALRMRTLAVGADEAKIRRDAEMAMRSEVAEAPLRGNTAALDRLIRLLESPEGRQLAAQGDRAKGILPVDPLFMHRLRESTPDMIKFFEDLKKDAAEWEREGSKVVAIQEKRRQGIRDTEAKLDATKKQAFDEQVSLLVSGKQQAFEAKYLDEFLTRISAGQSREQMVARMAPVFEKDIGDMPGATIAAERLANRVMEKAFAATIPFVGGDVGQPEAARRALGAEAQDRAEKAKKAAEAEARGEKAEAAKGVKAENQAEIDRIAKRFWELFPVTPQQAQAMAPGIFRASQRMDMDVAARRAYQQLTGEVNRAAFGPRRGRRGMGQVGPVIVPGMLDERVAPEPEAPPVQRRRRGPVPNRQAGADPLRQWQFERVTDVTPGLDPSRVNQMVGNVQVQEARTLAAVAHGTEQATVMARQAMSILSTVQSRMKMLSQNRPTLMSSVPGAGK
jgi:hypothetical protein